MSKKLSPQSILTGDNKSASYLKPAKLQTLMPERRVLEKGAGQFHNFFTKPKWHIIGGPMPYYNYEELHKNAQSAHKCLMIAPGRNAAAPSNAHDTVCFWTCLEIKDLQVTSVNIFVTVFWNWTSNLKSISILCLRLMSLLFHTAFQSQSELKTNNRFGKVCHKYSRLLFGLDTPFDLENNTWNKKQTLEHPR